MKRQFLLNPFSVLSLLLVLGVVFMGIWATADAQTPAFTLELVAKVPSPDGLKIEFINAIQVLDSNPNEVVFVTENQGATCGGGTPASAWKMTLDPDTGKAISVVLKQSLTMIQEVRKALFESSDGTLFTGGGWCGYKPPYYSTDGGETWQSADTGPVHPPNSTFSFVEFNGDVYAGTGYAPWHGQVYRWLGAGNWELVLDIPYPRTVVGTMAAYQNQLFVGSSVLDGGGCQNSVPVYVSSDGNTFNPTTGIPPCDAVIGLVVVGDQLVAQVNDYFDPTKRMYHWNNDLGEWEEIGVYNLGFSQPTLVSYDGVIYAYGQAPGDTSAGIYQSVDTGQTWQQIAVLENPDVFAMAIHPGTLYIGTCHDASDFAYIYRVKLVTESEIDIKPGSYPNSVNPRSKGVVPVAILTTDTLDATTVDPLSVQFGPNGATESHRRGHIEDVDGDGDQDLLLHFRTQDTGIECGDTSASLVGETFDGQAIEGSDSIKTVGCK